MGVLAQLKSFAAVIPQAKGNLSDLPRWLLRRPQVLAAVGTYEVALVFSGRMDPRLKQLAELKAATLITCEFCIDIGSAIAQRYGVTPEQLRELPRYADSDAFDADEKLVLELSEAMTRVPTTIDADLRERLFARFGRSAVVELVSTIAWENHRGRMNQAFGVRPSGFSDGAACAIAEVDPVQR